MAKKLVLLKELTSAIGEYLREDCAMAKLGDVLIIYAVCKTTNANNTSILVEVSLYNLWGTSEEEYYFYLSDRAEIKFSNRLHGMSFDTILKWLDYKFEFGVVRV